MGKPETDVIEVKKEVDELAREIAYKAHAGQFRNDGVTPYITHPVAVASKFFDPKLIAVALLHDVIEDCNVTAQDLLHAGIPFGVVESVILLTRDKTKDTYFGKIMMICKDEMARLVKIADIEHNIQTVTNPDKKDKYELALYILKSEGKPNGSVRTTIPSGNSQA